MNICEKHRMTMIEIGCEKCIEEIMATARNEGANTMLDDVLDVIRDEVSVQVYLKLEALRKKVD